MNNSIASTASSPTSIKASKAETQTDTDLSSIDSKKLLKNLNSAALVLSSLRQSQPDKVSLFLTNFRQAIEEQGLKALSNLKNIALAVAEKIGFKKADQRDVLNKSDTNAPAGFLWKPIADSPPNGLVILTPSSWNSDINSVQVVGSEDSRILATGKYSGVGNGDREHYRFEKAGNNFPDGSLVRILFKNGQERLIAISDTSARFEGKS